MENLKYTAVEFKFIERFEENFRLIDIVGKSSLNHLLIHNFCDAVEKQDNRIISSNIYDEIWGIETPIIIQGSIDYHTAISIFEKTWKIITRTCRFWIEDHIQEEYRWRQAWRLWENHAFSVVVVHAESLSLLYDKLESAWLEHRWISVNWQGESSSISGINAIAWSGMDRNLQFTGIESQLNFESIDRFYEKLNRKLEHYFIQKGEYLNIIELIQRLLTCKEILNNSNYKPIRSYSIQNLLMNCDLERTNNQLWTGWFQGGGDRITQYIRKMTIQEQNKIKNLQNFSNTINQWIKQSLKPSLSEILGQIIYAKRDEFLSIFDYPGQLNLSSYECLEWLYDFNSERKSSIWKQHGQPITISASFIWAAAGIRQQYVLRHCREAQQSAKQKGGDRLALRVLFKSGNYLEWICPWWFLQPVLEGYRDRSGQKNWRHIYTDIAQLESRHAFSGKDSEVALGLFQIYFGFDNRSILEKYLWETEGKAGILGNDRHDCSNSHQAIDNWIIKLAKIGFHLCQ
ncbi:hypothetical protein IQ235_05625 [Oscillatoriales cyanobacterium LEGE 11467]|uniref:Uncharacterized protein n=1 Tax=Zarconia navalis LEGE 11467 TaxID=1828826 RepID=A0A928Z8X7_9CYAN|nr:hypothetical protein [Zarconia navalis]MBE9040271.1 hypothetical protein [Zarconia navalis LEGE 11467]